MATEQPEVTGMEMRSGNIIGGSTENERDQERVGSASNLDKNLGPVGLVLEVTHLSGAGLGEVFSTPVVRNVLKEVCGLNPTNIKVLSETSVAVVFGERYGVLSKMGGNQAAGKLQDMGTWVCSPCKVVVTLVPHLDMMAMIQGENVNNSGRTASRARTQGHVMSETEDSDFDWMDEVPSRRGRRRSGRRQSRGGRARSLTDTETEGGSDTSAYPASSARKRRERAPTLKSFWGDPSKDEVEYGHWRAQVCMLEPSYSLSAMKEALSKSLKGAAFEILVEVPVGSENYLQEVLSCLDTIYGILPDYDLLFSQLSAAQQGESETVAEFAKRLSGVVKKIEFAFPSDKFPEREAQNASLQVLQRDRMYKGLRKSLRDALRPQFHGKMLRSFKEIVLLAREIEADDLTPKERASRGKGSGTAEPENPKARSVLPNPLKKFFGQKKQIYQKMGQLAEIPEEPQKEEKEEGEHDPEEAEFLEVVQSSVAQTLQNMGYSGEFKKPKNDTCYNCGGKGHISRECPSPKNSRDGNKPPVPSKDEKGASAQENKKQ